MPPIGFSTGAIALADFEAGIAINSSVGADAIELSALRDHELPRLAQALPHLDLANYRYVSIHAPSRFEQLTEAEVVEQLEAATGTLPIVVHPDTMVDLTLWRRLGDRVCIENMDSRKAFGSTVEDLRQAFVLLPEARFCLDIAHAYKLDTSFKNVRQMLLEFGGKLKEIHISELDAHFAHRPISMPVAQRFADVLAQFELRVPYIIESLVARQDANIELEIVRAIAGRPVGKRMAL